MFEDIITLRASFLIDRVLTGMRMDFDRALDMLKNHNDFTTERQKQERNMLVAAIDNLVDFAAAQQIQLFSELPKTTYREDTEQHEAVFEKYNLQYATEENLDIQYAAQIAAWWLSIPKSTYVTFMTQGDERVRPWHLSNEGLTFLKQDFPPELIPPIEWGCRCFLISNGFSSIHASAMKGNNTKNVNPIFCESLATGGKIFSSAHPYFKNQPGKEVDSIVNRIKQKMFVL